MLTVGIDVDGTLSDTMEQWLKYYKEEYNVVVSKEDLFLYDFSRIFPFVNKEVMRKYFEKVWDNWKDIKLIDKKVIPNINIIGNFYNVNIITSTWGNLNNVKKWLKENNIYFNKVKYVKNSIEKVNYCDILVDDSLSNITQMVNNNKIGILLKQPWNKRNLSDKIRKNILVAEDWQQVLEYLLNIKNLHSFTEITRK